MEREIISDDFIYSPIPKELPSVTCWKDVPLIESSEPLVPIGPFSEYPQIFTNSIYFGERTDSPYFDKRFNGSILTMFVRKEVADNLVKAQNSLPEGMELIVYDSYRSIDVQRSLFEYYYSKLEHSQPAWSVEQLLQETQKYVSLPSLESQKPSPHNTGGAVDLAIFSLPQSKGVPNSKT